MTHEDRARLGITMAEALEPNRLRELHARGLSQRAIAREIGVPKTTVGAHLKRLGLTGKSTESTPEVHQEEYGPGIDRVDLREVLEWWRTRREALAAARDTNRETQRTTFHVEQRWVDAIRRASDLEGATISEIVNRAFQQFFSQKKT